MYLIQLSYKFIILVIVTITEIIGPQIIIYYKLKNKYISFNVCVLFQ